jgi:hypothetical protein
MSANVSLRDRFISLCDGIQALAKEPHEERRLALHRFAARLGPNWYGLDHLVLVKELRFFGVNLQENPSLLAYSPNVTAALAVVRDLLAQSFDDDLSTWRQRMLDAERQLRIAVAAVASHPLDVWRDDSRTGVNSLLSALGNTDSTLATEALANRLASESRDFHVLAFELLGMDKNNVSPLHGVEGYELDHFLTKADYANLCAIVCGRLPWIAANVWWDADNVKRTAYMRAAIGSGVGAKLTTHAQPAPATPAGASAGEGKPLAGAHRDVSTGSPPAPVTPPAAPPPTGANAGEGEPLTGAERDKAFQALEPAVRKAYLAYQYAESKKGGRLEDPEAYELLDEDGITDQGNRGELIDYALPILATWSRQLRDARKALGEQKYKRRGHRTTRSIVKGNQLENQTGDA